MYHKLLIIACLFISVTGYSQDNLIPMFLPSATPQPIPKDDVKGKFTDIGSELPDFRAVTIPQGRILKKGSQEGVMEQREIIIKAMNITKKDVKNNANLLVMIFNPTCGHCAVMTDTLEHYIYLFKKSKLLMITGQNMGQYLEDFESEHNTNQYPTMLIGLDSSNFTNKIFLYNQLPQINIYDKERKLIKIFQGDISIDSLKRYIQ